MSVPNNELKQRLVVLVPEGLADDASLAEKAYKLALRNHYDVLYTALVSDVDNRMAVLRHMVTLSALTGSAEVAVKSVLIQSEDWIDKLRDYLRPGDQLACFSGHMVKTSWLASTPVCEVLVEKLDVPVVTLEGIYHPWKTVSRKWLYGLLFWLGCLAILAGFGALEFQMDHVLQGVARTAIISIALLVEFGVFWAWSHVPKM